MTAEGGNGLPECSPAATANDSGGQQRRMIVVAGSGAPAETISSGPRAWTTHSWTSKLEGARTASSELRLRCGWCLRLRLDERNIIVALHVQNSQGLRSYG